MIIDPNISQTPYRTYSPDKILFGAFQDSCPDRWGRTLIDRRESITTTLEHRRPRKLSDTGYLLGLQDICRSGGFRFKTDESGEFLSNEEVMEIGNNFYSRNDALGLCYELINKSTNLWLKEDDTYIDDITVVSVFF